MAYQAVVVDPDWDQEKALPKSGGGVVTSN